VRWSAFAAAAPELAAAGESLFGAFTVAYLATLRRDGAPRIHPVTVTLYDGGLYMFALAGSYKAADLVRDPRFALHSFPRAWSDLGWDDEELAVSGRANPVDGADHRASVAIAHNDAVGDGDRLFELSVERAFHKRRDAGVLRHESWREGR
jgi:Pyridoxamine 5'-phosphate oxidase